MRQDSHLKSFQYKSSYPHGHYPFTGQNVSPISIDPLAVLFQVQYVRLSQACQHCSGAYTR
jgi:hypothetical protein